MPMREALRGRPSVPGRGGFPDRPQARTRRGRVPAGLFRGAFAAVFSAVLLGPALPAARAEEPTPPWKFDDSPKRAVFRVATGQPFVVVRLPAVLPGGATVSAVRAATAQEDRPCHVLVVSRDGIDVLVDCTDLGTNTPVALYLVPGDVPPPVTDSPFSDPLPVRVEVRHAGGHDIPPSSDGLRFLLDRQLGGPFLFALPAFGPVESTPPNNWYRGGWERPAYVAKLESWLVVPEAGAYAFSLGDVAPSYLAVDGVERVARARDAALHPNDWTEGEPFRLEPGLHRVEILSICERAIRMKVGWLPPGAKEFEPIPPARLASGGRTTPLRFETRYDILHAAFTGRPGPAYAFRGSNALFTPVRLKSSTAFWGEGAVTCEWTGEGGRALGTGDAILAIVSGTGDIPVTLRARATTPNGSFESVATDVIPLPFVPAREYLVAGRLAGIPAVCYEDDPVRPELHVRSTASPGVDLEARAVLRSPSGETATFSAPLQLVQTWGRLQIPPRFARDIASLEWEVLHAGAVIASGAAVFHRAPFAEAPAALDGDLLTDASGAVSVLVAPRASAGETADSASVGAAATGLPAGGAPAAIFLDGFFLSGDAVTEGTAAAAMPPGPAGETPSPRQMQRAQRAFRWRKPGGRGSVRAANKGYSHAKDAKSAKFVLVGVSHKGHKSGGSGRGGAVVTSGRGPACRTSLVACPQRGKKREGLLARQAPQRARS